LSNPSPRVEDSMSPVYYLPPATPDTGWDTKEHAHAIPMYVDCVGMPLSLTADG